MNNFSQHATHGKIMHWNSEKDFGFISSMTLGEEGVFVHKNSMLDKENLPQVGQLVSYNLSKDRTGRVVASNIRKPGDRVISPRTKSKSPLLLMALLFIGVAANAVVLE